MKQPRVNVKALSQAIAQKMRDKKLGQIDLAKKAGVPPDRVSRFCDENFVRLSPILEKICQKLGLNSQDYLSHKEAPLSNGLILKLHHSLSGNVTKQRALQRILKALTDFSS
jgi:DNA-binding Xre family transcriptional regulator